MSQDMALWFGIALIFFIGACVGWYLCVVWYEKRIFTMIDACHTLNAHTISTLEKTLETKRDIQELYKEHKS